MKAKEVKRNVMKGLCLIAVLSAILLFYKVLYEQLSYTVAHLIDMFTLPVHVETVVLMSKVKEKNSEKV